MKYLFGLILLITVTAAAILITPSLKPVSEKVITKTNESVQELYELKETIAPAPTTILPNGLPDKHLITTAFVPQAPEKKWDQPWQDACEEAALLTVDLYYQNINPSIAEIKTKLLDMIAYEDKLGWSHDINASQMSEVARIHLNYETLLIPDPTIDSLKAYLAKDIPVIIPANGKTLYKENRHFKDGGPYYHNVVLLGYDDTRQQFIVHDVGTQHGAYFRYSYGLLMDSIHDFPESGIKSDITKGNKIALILLK